MSELKVKASYYDILQSPVVTEKSTTAGEFNKYTFKVATYATKEQVTDAISSIFNVEVSKVNIINVKGKVKRFKGRIGKRNNEKKAIVTDLLKEMLTAKNISITDEQLNILIEAAVKQMKMEENAGIVIEAVDEQTTKTE